MPGGAGVPTVFVAMPRAKGKQRTAPDPRGPTKSGMSHESLDRIAEVMGFCMSAAEDQKEDASTDAAHSGACLVKDARSCDECWKLGVKLFRCKGCGTQDYCSRECQMKAWKGKYSDGHRETCKAYAAMEAWHPVAGTGGGVAKFSARRAFADGKASGTFDAPPAPEPLPEADFADDGSRLATLNDAQLAACLARLPRCEHAKLCCVSARVRALVLDPAGVVAARRRCPLTGRDLTEPMIVWVGGTETNWNLHGRVTMLDARGTWIAMRRYPKPVSAQRVVALGGEVYSMGGMHAPFLNREGVWKANAGRACACVMVYSPLHDKWRAVAPMLTPRLSFGAVAAAGKIFVFGGAQRMVMDRGDCADRCEAYDPATQKWSRRAAIPVPMEGPTVVAVGGKVYLLGGQKTPPGSTSDALQIYDVATDTWTVGRMPVPRKGFSAFVVGPKIVCLGGMDENDQCVKTTFCLDTATSTWSRLADAPEKHAGFFVRVGDRLCTLDANNCPADYSIADDAWRSDVDLPALPLWHKIHTIEPATLSLAI